MDENFSNNTAGLVTSLKEVRRVECEKPIYPNTNYTN